MYDGVVLEVSVSSKLPRRAHRLDARLACFAVSLASAVATGCAAAAPPPDTSNQPQQHDRPCTAMACSDQLSVVIHLAPADAAPGRHRFDLTIDGRVVTCSVDVVRAGESVSTTCGAGISVRLGATMRGVEVPSPVPGTVMHGEEPVPGEFQADLDFYGTPQSVRIVHAADGRPAFDRTVTASYATVRPNGPGCEPACQAATVEMR